MKLEVPDAGKRPIKITRRQFLRSGLASAFFVALGAAAKEPAKIIVPAMAYTGARLLRAVDPQGMPDFRSDPFGQLTLFVFPVSVAAGPMDVYIADAGLSTLFRYDPAIDAMMAIPGVQVTQQTKISALPDGSVLVVERHQGAPRRFSRTGRQMQTIAPLNTGSLFDEVLIDPASGRYLALDRVQRRLEEVHPVGRSGSILGEDLLPRLPVAMALDDRILYVNSQECQCIEAIDLAKRQKFVLVEDVIQVSGMAAGDGWLVVADNGERVLRIYRQNVLVGDPSYESLHLVNPQGLSISRGTLYVADPGTRRIATFRLRS